MPNTDEGTAKATAQKHDEAEEYLKMAEEEFEHIDDRINADTRAQWEAEEAQWLEDVLDIKKHAKLHNPYEPDPDKSEYAIIYLYRACSLTLNIALTQKQALSMLLRADDESTSSGERGMVGAIAEGIELENAR